MITFDGNNRICTLESGVLRYSAAEIYSRWKDWVQAGNGWARPMFDVVEGNAPATEIQNTPTFYFVRNDLKWKIKTFEEDIETEIDGNMLPRVPTGDKIFVNTDGSFNTFIRVNTFNVASVNVSGGGSGGLSQADIEAIAAETAAQSADLIVNPTATASERLINQNNTIYGSEYFIP